MIGGVFMQNIFKINVDLKKSVPLKTPILTEGDSVAFEVSVFDDGKVFDLSNASRCVLLTVKPDGNVTAKDGKVTGVNKVTFNLGYLETSIVGKIKSVIQVYDLEGRVSSFPFNFVVKNDPSNDYVSQSPDTPLLQTLIKDTTNLINILTQKSDYAQQQGDYAKKQGDYAANEARNLSKLKTDVTYATQLANSSAVSANNAANNANTQATNAQNAAQSANTAATNANNAASSANTKASYAQQQGDYAKTQGDYAKTHGDYAKSHGDYAKTHGDYAKSQGDYAKTQGDYAKEQGYAANLAANNANTQATTANEAANNATNQANYAKSQGDYAKTQGDYAKSQGNYAKTQGDYAKQVGDENKTRWLTAVKTYADIATTYPNPKLGDTVQTIDDSKIYRWDGTQWIWTQQYNANAITDVQNKIGILSTTKPNTTTNSRQSYSGNTSNYTPIDYDSEKGKSYTQKYDSIQDLDKLYQDWRTANPNSEYTSDQFQRLAYDNKWGPVHDFIYNYTLPTTNNSNTTKPTTSTTNTVDLSGMNAAPGWDDLPETVVTPTTEIS